MHDLLSSKHAIPGLVDFVEGNGGLIKAVVNTKWSTGEVYLQGAHITQFNPVNQQPVLFLSQSSRFEPGKSIRGGVPICFPWFGALEGRDTAPAHGFARTKLWGMEAVKSNADGSATLVMNLTSDEWRDDLWPHAYRAQFAVTFGSSLKMELTISHTRGEPFIFEEALHTYFHVGDIRQVAVTGLNSTPFLDKTRGMNEFPGDTSPIQFTNETDRVYLETTSQCIIEDKKLARKLVIKKSGSDSTVVWNPWINKSKAMPDFGDNEWPSMLCVETCNVGPCAVKLGPGQSHVMIAEIESIPAS